MRPVDAEHVGKCGSRDSVQILAPFLFGTTKRLLTESFADPNGELPRRIVAKPQLYGMVRRAVAEAETFGSLGPGSSAAARHQFRRALSCRSRGVLDGAVPQ